MDPKKGFTKKEFGWIRKSRFGTTVLYNEPVGNTRWCKESKSWVKRKYCKKCKFVDGKTCTYVVKKPKGK
jgi:hypothetical protein